ncbi:MAG: sigma-70 family RNA polymerase sigma factor [Planctomycetes bacterium]|nr:sigma-70 family RNA polymerase sigma factor [Planctomycetota bacterium]
MRDSNLSSLDLLDQARRKSETASYELLLRFREPLLNRIRLMMGAHVRSLAESDDFLQEVMVDFLKASNRADLQNENDILRWMTAVARNNIRDVGRRRRIRAFESFSASFSSDDIAEQKPTPGSQLALHEDAIRLAESIEKLKDDYRKVIELHDLEGIDLKEIASRMGRTYGAAKKLHTRALIKLGMFLSPGS